MEGYLRLRINPWMRRLLTRLVAIVPAVIVILINGENNIDSLLVLSQVVLSLQLGFAIIPLIHFVSDRNTMGQYTIKPLTQFLAWAITAVLVYLNIRMVSEQATTYFSESDSIAGKLLIVLAGLLYMGLLLVALIYPLLKRQPRNVVVPMHPPAAALPETLAPPVYHRIAVALDFSTADQQLLAHALGQATPQTTFILIHIVESVSARVLGTEADDLETRKDAEKLEGYAAQLQQYGFRAEALLGFERRTQEILRLVKKSGAGLLVIGAHGHSGVKDWFYGETIDAVRHRLKIPVLIVHKK
jgi:manganese transport protein